MAAGIRLGMAFSEGPNYPVVEDASCAYPSLSAAHWVSVQLGLSFHRALVSRKPSLGSGFHIPYFILSPLRFGHRIGRHLLSTLPTVRTPVVQEGPLHASIQLSSMEPKAQ